MTGWGIIEYAMAVIGVSGLIAWHEFGHYLLARLLGMRVIRYSIGFGPKIWGFRRAGIEYQLAAIPFGGFVQIFGMSGAEEGAFEAKDSYMMRPRWARFLVLAAGPLFNYILAAFLFFGMFLMWPGGNVRLHGVFENSAAATAGLLPGDEIVAVNGHALSSDDQFRNYIQMGESLSFSIHRTPVLTKKYQAAFEIFELKKAYPELKGDHDKVKESLLELHEKQVEAKEEASKSPNDAEKEKLLQVLTERVLEVKAAQKKQIAALTRLEEAEAQEKAAKNSKTQLEISVVPLKKNFGYQLGVMPRFEEDSTRASNVIDALIGALTLCVYKSEEQLRGLASIFVKDQGGQLSGPLGIAKMLAKKAHDNGKEFIYILGVLSVTLAVFNIIPIPALDGFKMMWLGIEMLLRREVLPKVQMWMNVLGFFLLMGTMLYVTLANDLF